MNPNFQKGGADFHAPSDGVPTVYSVQQIDTLKQQGTAAPSGARDVPFASAVAGFR